MINHKTMLNMGIMHDEDDDSNFDLHESMRHFGLMANLRGYMAGGKEWILDSGCNHMTG